MLTLVSLEARVHGLAAARADLSAVDHATHGEWYREICGWVVSWEGSWRLKDGLVWKGENAGRIYSRGHDEQVMNNGEGIHEERGKEF